MTRDGHPGDAGLDLLRELLTLVQTEQARVDALAAQDEVDADGADARRATAARRGDLGLEWKAVQDRIDAGRTTLTAVFCGTDETPEAVALRSRASRRLREQGDRWREEDDDSRPPGPARVLHGAAAESHAHALRAARRIAQDMTR